MRKRSKSQWDFGELFPPESVGAGAGRGAETVPEAPAIPAASVPAAARGRRILSVSELTAQIKRLLEKEVGTLWVTGEITNLRAQSSGHMYFTLKDAGAHLSCVLFRGEKIAHRDLLQDGQKLLLQGDVTVYEARGQYQLIVRAVELQGIGALQVAFEKLKQRLQAEGLFAQERKRPLPGYPQRIGLVTSPTGAAIRDVLHVVQRRNPGLEIILAPCRVQGEGAAGEIAAAVRLLNEFEIRNPGSKIDLILVTRGGGSLEVWAFNEEVVARAIFESAVPVMSAVGHEIDFTISDFVADVRAATPSAGAEIITEGVYASREFAAEAARRMRQRVGREFAGKADELTQVRNRLARVHPRRQFNEWLQRLDDLQTGLRRCVRQAAREQSAAARTLFERLVRVRPSQLLKQRRELFSQTRQQLQDRAGQRLRERVNELETLAARLRLLGPEQVLARGYSITRDAATGKVVRDAGRVKTGQRLKTRLKIGEVESRVENVGQSKPTKAKSS